MPCFWNWRVSLHWIPFQKVHRPILKSTDKTYRLDWHIFPNADFGLCFGLYIALFWQKVGLCIGYIMTPLRPESAVDIKKSRLLYMPEKLFQARKVTTLWKCIASNLVTHSVYSVNSVLLIKVKLCLTFETEEYLCIEFNLKKCIRPF